MPESVSDDPPARKSSGGSRFRDDPAALVVTNDTDATPDHDWSHWRSFVKGETEPAPAAEPEVPPSPASTIEDDSPVTAPTTPAEEVSSTLGAPSISDKATEFEVPLADDARDDRALVIPRPSSAAAVNPHAVMSVRAVAGMNDPNPPVLPAQAPPPAIVRAGTAQVKVPALHDLFDKTGDVETPEAHELPPSEWGNVGKGRVRSNFNAAGSASFDSDPRAVTGDVREVLRGRRRLLVVVAVTLTIVIASLLWGDLFRSVSAAPASDPMNLCATAPETVASTDPAQLLHRLVTPSAGFSALPDYTPGAGPLPDTGGDSRVRAGFSRLYAGGQSRVTVVIKQYASPQCAELAFGRFEGAPAADVSSATRQATTVSGTLTTHRSFSVAGGRSAEITWIAPTSALDTQVVASFVERQAAALA